MMRWWLSREPRERRVLAVGGLALGAAALFLYVLEPLAQNAELLAVQTTAARASTARLRELAETARALRTRQANAVVFPPGQSLLAVLNDSAASHQLQSALIRVVPNGESEASVTLEAAPYVNVAAWLVTLEQRFGVRAARAQIDSVGSPGVVNATLTFAVGQGG